MALILFCALVKAKKISCLDFFLEAAVRHPDATCIWTRQQTYTWSQARMQYVKYLIFRSDFSVILSSNFLTPLLALRSLIASRSGFLPVYHYASKLCLRCLVIWSSELTLKSVAQYANFIHKNLLLGQASVCGFYLPNSATFLFAWLGLWAVGSAPAMINVNLTGSALVNSLKVSGAKVVLIDEDEKIKQRIEGARAEIEALGIKIVVLGEEKKKEIEGVEEVEMVDESFRRDVKGRDPFGIFYTRFVLGATTALYSCRANY